MAYVTLPKLRLSQRADAPSACLMNCLLCAGYWFPDRLVSCQHCPRRGTPELTPLHWFWQCPHLKHSPVHIAVVYQIATQVMQCNLAWGAFISVASSPFHILTKCALHSVGDAPLRWPAGTYITAGHVCCAPWTSAKCPKC